MYLILLVIAMPRTYSHPYWNASQKAKTRIKVTLTQHVLSPAAINFAVLASIPTCEKI